METRMCNQTNAEQKGTMSRRAVIQRTAFLLGSIIFAGLHAQASTIFSNLDGSNGYNANGGQLITGSGSSYGSYSAAAEAFTPSTNYSLTQIGVALTFFPNGSLSDSDAAIITLASDNAGLPGTAIESWSVSGLPMFGSTGTTLQNVSPLSSVILTAGVQYWVIVTPGASNTQDSWDINDIGSTELTAREFGTGTWGLNGTPPAFDVLGTSSSSSPEPSTFAFMGIGLGITAYLQRRKSLGKRKK